MIEVGHTSHTGLRRELNEDTYWADADLGLFLVADGMGGHGRGEVAAALARDALVDAARTGRELESAIRDAGAGIAASARRAPGDAPTGAALALLRLEAGRYAAACIGDTRIYLWRAGTLQRLCREDPATTGDGGGAPEAAAPLPKRNRATQALGITPPRDLCAELHRGVLERDVQFLLCSDGLSEELADGRIAAMLARTDLAAQECVDHLLLAALEAGGRDNISLVLVRVN